MLQRHALRGSLLALILAALFAAPALAAPAVSGEFPLKTEIGSKIVAGPDGNAWVTLGGEGENVARITPAGAVTEFDLGLKNALGITVGPDNNLWVTSEGGLSRFAAADPKGSLKSFGIPGLGESSIVTGPDGRLWIATKDLVLAASLAFPNEPQAFPVPELAPKDIDVAGGLLVVADNSGNPRVVTMTTAGVKAEYKIPGGSQGVAGAPSGLIGFSQQGKAPEQVGLISPPTLQPLIETPGGGGDPFGAALGIDGAFWFAMSANDGVARLTPTGQLTLLDGFAKGSFPRQIAPGPGNTLWVTLDMTDKVGRISGLEPPLTPPPPPPPRIKTVPQTKIQGGPKGVLRTAKKFKPVQFGFTSPDLATTFECRMRKLAQKAGSKAAASKAKAKVPKFKPCASPKGYKLRPGRYSFEVRASNDGLVDPTPAKRGFRVVAVKKPVTPNR